jgi:hypothetical protein
MTSEYNLADQTLAALSAPKVGLISYESVPNICPSVARRNSKGERVRLTPHSRDRIKGAYNGLRKATRYTVDESMVRHAVSLSMTIDADELLAIIGDAVPPNTPMWIEWDEKVRQEAIGEHYLTTNNTVAHSMWSAGLSGTSDYVGYFIEELDYPFIGTGEEDHYCFSPVYPLGKEGQAVTRQRIMFDGSAFELSPHPWSDKDHRAFHQDFSFTPSDSGEYEQEYKQHLNTHAENVRMLLGVQWFNEQLQSVPEDRYSDWPFIGLTNHIHAVQSRSIDWMVPRMSGDDPDYSGEDHEAITKLSGTIASAGDARFLICLLHVLNYDWVIKSPRPMTGRGGLRYGKPIKFNSHIVLEIDLPKVNGVSITPDDYLEEVRGMKRLHDVRGHFRRLHDGRRVWVKSHKRGNKELGTITKDYLLTNKSKERSS